MLDLLEVVHVMNNVIIFPNQSVSFLEDEKRLQIDPGDNLLTTVQKMDQYMTRYLHTGGGNLVGGGHDEERYQ